MICEDVHERYLLARPSFPKDEYRLAVDKAKCEAFGDSKFYAVVIPTQKGVSISHDAVEDEPEFEFIEYVTFTFVRYQGSSRVFLRSFEIQGKGD